MFRRIPNRIRRTDRGYIMFVSLGFAILLGLGSLLAITPTAWEVNNSGNQLRDKRTFNKADGGAAICRGEFRNRLNTALPAQLAGLANLINVGTYVTNNDPAGFLAAYAYQNGTSFGAAFIRDSATQAHLPLTYTAAAGATPYTCILTVISRAAPVNQGSVISPQYLFKYWYTINGTGTEGGQSHQVNMQGIFSVIVQQNNFARYALFTVIQSDEAGDTVWFTNRTNFSGPVHTNGQFNFANNPSGTFTGVVDSVNTKANYYNNGSPVQLAATYNGTLDVPTFGAGLTLGSASVPMPATTTADNQRDIALGLPPGGNTSGYGAGVTLGTASGAMTGGIYIKNNATVSLSAPGGSRAVYTITQGATTWTVTANFSTNQTTIQQGSNPATTYTGLPNGMLFCDGQITSLAGTVEGDTQLTVAATGDVMITNNLTYQNYTTSGTTPSAAGTTNLLGIISWNNDVHITTAAPNDISVHATIMAPNGEFHVDNYSSGSPRGTATLLGGVIENTYGAFGTFSGSTQESGYGRNFVYDTRMGTGIAPPFFPTAGAVISTATGINDRPNWQQTN